MMDGSRTLPFRAFAAPRPSEPAPLLPQPPWQRRDVGQQHPTSPGTQFWDGTAADADPRLLVPPVLLRPLLLHRVKQPQDEALLFGCFLVQNVRRRMYDTKMAEAFIHAIQSVSQASCLSSHLHKRLRHPGEEEAKGEAYQLEA